MCSRTILAFWASRRPTRSGLHHAAADAARWRDGAFIPGSFTDKMLLERRSNSISFCVDQTWRNKDSLGPAQFPVLCSVVVGSFIWGGGGMADSVQPTQRNLYQKGVTGTYRDGTGTLYTEQLKKLSCCFADVWCVARTPRRENLPGVYDVYCNARWVEICGTHAMYDNHAFSLIGPRKKVRIHRVPHQTRQ